jgi:hypothetical protein
MRMRMMRDTMRPKYPRLMRTEPLDTYRLYDNHGLWRSLEMPHTFYFYFLITLYPTL